MMVSTTLGLDPLAVVRTVYRLTHEAEAKYEVKVEVRFDFEGLHEARLEVRNTPPSPYFDYRYNDFRPDTAFWLRGHRDDRTVFLHAFRLDTVEQDLRGWVINWLLGLHTRAGEHVAIAEPELPTSPNVATLRGRLAYQGELWVARGQTRGSGAAGALDLLPRLGLMCAYMHWKPDAVWALVQDSSVMRGGVFRAGNPYAERDFIRWSKPPSDVLSESESLSIITRAQLEHLIRQHQAQ